MTIAAALKNGVLKLSGSSDNEDEYGSVTIYDFTTPIEILDGWNDDRKVPVTSDGSALKTIDARALTGHGIDVMAFEATLVYGSEEDDDITLASGQGAGASGGGGDDRLSGSQFANDGERLNGGAGNDDLFGYGGNDTLTGGKGDDLIDGGLGSDTAVYGGRRSDYRIEVVDGAYRVTDLRRNAPDGVDTVGNVEKLQFSDRLVSLPALSTNLVSSVRNGVQTIAGEAFSEMPWKQVSAGDLGGQSTVQDNDAVGLYVPVTGDGSAVTTIDARALTGAGIFVSTFEARLVYGSEQADYLFLNGGIEGAGLSGGGGDDYLYGGSEANRLNGGAGNDTLYGYGGGDTLTGGKGNDLIDGGLGTDVAVYGGKRSDYRVRSLDGSYTITDLRRNGPDGVDTLTGVEALKFSDGQFDIARLIA